MEQIKSTEHSKPLAYTCEEFGKMTRISMPTVYELIHSEGFPALRVGKKYLIPVKAAERWLEANIGKQVLSE